MPFKIFSGVYDSFQETGENLDFFESELYIEKTVNRVQKAKAASPVVRDYVFLPTLIALLAEKGKLSALDFGGGPGAAYLSLHHVSPLLTDGLTFHVFDNSRICTLGREACNGLPNIEFFDNPNDLLSEYDLIHFGSVLQYIDDLSSLLEFVGAKRAKMILVSDAMVGVGRSFVTVADYYGLKHPHAFHALPDIRKLFSGVGYDLVATIPYIPNIQGRYEFYDMTNLPEDCRTETTAHLLFKRTI